jgi:ribosomal protein S18 acetylase RimI-like enzyme
MRTTVRLTTDKAELHAFLQADPIWAAYAIGDLEPSHFAWCTWHVADDAAGRLAGLVLLYGRLDPPVLLTMGETAAAAAILQQMALPQRVYISARAEHLPLLLERYDFSSDRVRPMLRMAVTATTFQSAAWPVQYQPSFEESGIPRCRSHVGVRTPRIVGEEAWASAGLALRRLSASDVPAIEALIALGGPFAPDAFSPQQVAEGLFIGLQQTDPGGVTPHLLAMAGTHLVAPTWGVAAVGNVYVHPAQRGQGYGALVSSAVTAELLQRGLRVVLNVDQNNPAAINLYRQLGFAVHCPFVEGIGRRVDW